MTQTNSPAVRRIVLTGVTRGLGRVLTERLIAEGHRVAGCGRNEEHINSLQRHHPAHRFSMVDVADDLQVAKWAADVLGNFGAPDLLICNAALMNTPAPLWDIGAEEFGRLIDVNIKGVANTIRHFVPAMIAAGAGVVVTLSSGWGKYASPNVAPYCASKFAIEGLTAALAKELPEGLAAVAVSPGVIDTDMLAQAMGDGAKQHITPAQWVERAAPFLLGLTTKNNGQSLRIGE